MSDTTRERLTKIGLGTLSEAETAEVVSGQTARIMELAADGCGMLLLHFKDKHNNEWIGAATAGPLVRSAVTSLEWESILNKDLELELIQFKVVEP